MGFQFRKRTKGKQGWLNFSGSKKNGLGASLSLKFGKNVTYNSRGRVTINFGNGLRYVAYKKKKRQPKTNTTPKTSSRSYTYKAVEYKPTPTQNEILCSVQEVLRNEVKMHNVVDSADLQVLVDLYNAVELLKEEPDSVDNIDLIIVTTNQFKEVAKKINKPDLIKSANIVSDYLRSVLPKKTKPTPTPLTPQERTKYNRWMVGILFVVIFALQMCSR